MNKKEKINQIYRAIKKIKIQGATNIAKAALHAYSLMPTKATKKKLINTRPTEPLLVNVLNKTDKLGYKKTLAHFENAQDKINKNVLKIIKPDARIFTHCHSTSVVEALIYAKKKGKKFEVLNTETRPLYQGRKTAEQLEKAGIKVTMFIDSASALAIEKENKKDKIYADYVFLGADAILKNGDVINKIGSGMISEIAYKNKIPVYIIADSWKFTPKNVKIEERDFHEVWKNAPKHIKIKNPAFEKVPSRYIKAIVSELGILNPKKFVKKARKN